MTAKSEMVCYRLLSLDGKGRLIVMGHACLWQNAPAQILVRLSILSYTIAPLRANQKYVYSDLKLHVYKITRYSNKLDLYPIVYQRLTNAFLKGALLPCKRASFTPQKSTFYPAKGHLLPCQSHLLFSIYEYLLQPFLCPFPFHNKRVSLPLHYYNNTIKTTTSQFSCHSCHSSPHHNALITSLLCEMLKVTATKNKNYVRVLE